MVWVNSQSLARIRTTVRPGRDPAGKSNPDAAGYLRATVREDDRLDNDREDGSDARWDQAAQKRPTMREIEWHDVNVTRQISLGMAAMRFLSFLRLCDPAERSGARASGVGRGIIRKNGYYLGRRRIAGNSSENIERRAPCNDRL